MPKVKRYLNPQYLRMLFRYDAVTGKLYWKVNAGRWGRIEAGTEAGNVGPNGYRNIGIDGEVYTAGPIIWAIVYGVWPDTVIDHRNKIKDDNRLMNLRKCEEKNNIRNRGSKNKHGLKGITTKRGLFRARIMVDGKSIHIGYYTTKEEAHRAYMDKARELHGKFASD